MTLIQTYNSLTRGEQIRLKAFWMQKTGMSSTSFYKHFRHPTPTDVAICEEFLKEK